MYRKSSYWQIKSSLAKECPHLIVALRYLLLCDIPHCLIPEKTGRTQA